jgi:hypothetical protein
VGTAETDNFTHFKSPSDDLPRCEAARQEKYQQGKWPGAGSPPPGPIPLVEGILGPCPITCDA